MRKLHRHRFVGFDIMQFKELFGFRSTSPVAKDNIDGEPGGIRHLHALRRLKNPKFAAKKETPSPPKRGGGYRLVVNGEQGSRRGSKI